jgi:hypothetical protein
MSEKQTGGPAFPVPSWIGMTLRDYFAAKALQGYLASCPQEVEPVEFSVQISRDSYLIADAMLEARK